MSEVKKIFTTPNVRKFARELGANISEIKGTQRKGRVSHEDVKNFINNQLNENKQPNKSKIEFKHSAIKLNRFTTLSGVPLNFSLSFSS